MEQLTGVDAGFLHMETPNTFGHVGSLSVLEAPAHGEGLTLDQVRELLEQRMHLLPQFRRRLAEVPFGLDRPYWVEDPDFDLDYHVRELALPAPGSDAQLAEQISRIVSRPLDRTRPLWELYLVSGLQGDRSALLVTFHHAAVDGVGGRDMMMTLLDSEPDAVRTPPPPRHAPDRMPTESEMLLRGLTGLARQPWRMLRLQARLLAALPAATASVGRALAPALSAATGVRPGGDGQLLRAAGLVAPRTSLNRTITPHRRWVFGSVSLGTVKQVKAAYGVTVNDVVMAMCAGALRRWLLAHGELPAEPLLAMVPISVRKPGSQAGNQVSAMVAALPTQLADPVERLRAVHEAMKAAKGTYGAIDADILTDMTQFTMPALAVRAARVAHQWRIADVLHPAFNVVVSNVPGPREPLYVCGARLAHYYPVSVVSDGLGLNITVQSYLDSLDFGLIACRELVPDVALLIGYLADALDELVSAAPA